MTFLSFFIILIIIGGIIGIIYINFYNQIQYQITKIEKAEFSIDEVLRKRIDIIKQFNDIIQNKLSEKRNYLKEYINLKTDSMTNFEVDQKLKEAMNIVQNLAHDHKPLQKETRIQELLFEIKQTEEQLSAAKAYYNRYTENYNDLIRKFPANVVAQIHRLKVKTYFDKKDMQDDDDIDFKL